jgi:DNA invertase Pin-like site-specific DNA recombinase
MHDQAERAGIWLRVSKTGQDEESQRPDIMRWVESHNYCVSEEYVVHGKSAFKGNRKFDATWTRVLDDMHSGRITVLVVWKQDRIDRKLNIFQMMAQVVEAGGRVEFVTQPHLNDLTTMGGRIALKVQEEIAYAESKDKSDRIHIKFAAKRAAGSAIGKAPWGYEIVMRDGVKVFVPTAEGREHAPRVFHLVIDGKSLRDVARYLLVATGREWNERYLPRLISNPIYHGQRRNAGQLVTEGLVNYSTWQAANAAMATRAYRGRGTTVHDKALLAPACGNPDCREIRVANTPNGVAVPDGDSPMYRVFAGRHDKRYAYYRCTGKGRQRVGCSNMVLCELADEWVTDAMLADRNPHPMRVFVPGVDRADKIGKLRAAAMNAYMQGDRETFERMDAEATELEALPASPSHWEEFYICHTCGQVKDIAACMASGHQFNTNADHFAALDTAQRREELAQHWEISLSKDGVGLFPRTWL